MGENIEKFEALPFEKRESIYRAGLLEFSAKPFCEASTDAITASCGISKGLLFHYFGSKKAFYLYCLRHALEVLVAPGDEPEGDTFYDLLFHSMDAKFALCLDHPLETYMVNMASRDAASEIADDKAALLREYTQEVRRRSAETMAKALTKLSLKATCASIAHSGLTLYATALINRYLLAYQDKPDAFFIQSKRVKQEFRDYMDLMLKGIQQEDTP